MGGTHYKVANVKCCTLNFDAFTVNLGGSCDGAVSASDTFALKSRPIFHSPLMKAVEQSNEYGGGLGAYL